MSLDPPPLPQIPPPEISQPVPASQVRPASVMVFGIICIIFASIALLCSPISLMMPFINARMGVITSPAFHTYSLISVIIGLPIAAWELISGIGLVRSRPWARRSAVTFAIVGIALQFVNTPIAIFMVLQEGQIMRDPAARIGGLIGGTFGAVVSLTFFSLMIFFLTRPAVKSYFASRT